MLEIIILLLIGLAAGVASGILGIGGGLIIIPSLVIFLKYSQKTAQGTSLALLLLPIGFLAVMNYYKMGYVNIKAAALMIVTFVIGSYFSSKMIVSFPENIVKKIFAGFLLIYAIKLFTEK